MFTGGSQFGLIGVVAGGGAPLAGAATAIMLGARNALYGLRLPSCSTSAGGAGSRPRNWSSTSRRRCRSAGTPSGRPGWVSTPPASACSCCGTSARCRGARRVLAVRPAAARPGRRRAGRVPGAAGAAAARPGGLGRRAGRRPGGAGRGAVRAGGVPGADRRAGRGGRGLPRPRFGRRRTRGSTRRRRPARARHDPLDRHPGRLPGLLPAQAGRPVGAARRCWSDPKVQRIAALLPVVLLSALVAVQTFSHRVGPGAGRPGRRAGGGRHRRLAALAVPGGGRRWRRSPPRWSGCGCRAADRVPRGVRCPSRSRPLVPRQSEPAGPASAGAQEAVQHPGAELQRVDRHPLVDAVEHRRRSPGRRQLQRREAEAARCRAGAKDLSSVPPESMYGTARAVGSSASSAACMASTSAPVERDLQRRCARSTRCSHAAPEDPGELVAERAPRSRAGPGSRRSPSAWPG